MNQVSGSAGASLRAARMLSAGLSLAAALATPSLAQAPSPAPVPTGPMMVSRQEIAAMAAAARAGAAAGQPQATRVIVGEAPYRLQVEHRIANTPPSIHEKAAELLVVIGGEGLATLGGELVGATRANPTTQRGVAIRGGQSRRIAEGDVIWVPSGVPHGFTEIKGTLVMTAIHMPVGE